MEAKRYLTLDGFVIEDTLGQRWASKDGQAWEPVKEPKVGTTCIFCNKGWEASGPGWLDQTELVRSGTVHESCYQQWLGTKDIEMFLGLCGNYGLDARSLRPKRIEDGYWKGRGRPWVEVRVGEDFRLCFGLRKHVWETKVTSWRGEEWFPKGMVTALRDMCGDDTFIDNGSVLTVHCWNKDTVEERIGYVLKTLTALQAPVGD